MVAFKFIEGQRGGAPLFINHRWTLVVVVYLQAWKRSYSARRPWFLNLTTSEFWETSSSFELDNIRILGDFLKFWTWQFQKRNNSARLPQFSKLAASKTKQFSETSFKKGKLSAELTASYPCVLQFFHSICLKYCGRHEKVMPAHCHAKSSQQTWRYDTPKCNPSHHPDLLASLMNTSPVLHLPRDMHLRRSSSHVPRLPTFLKVLQNPHVLLTFRRVQNPSRPPHKITS